MNYDAIIGMLFGAFLTLVVEGMLMTYFTFKWKKDGIFDETSESYTKEI